MTDYRLQSNRRAYFDALYAMNLEHRCMPGMVYTYMPELAKRLGWEKEQKLWFAFLNGLTQNPITSLILMEQLPIRPLEWAALVKFESWFDENWDRLQFDTDRRYQKKNTIQAILSYTKLATEMGGQTSLLTNTYPELWERMSQIISFGRLSTFSYLEFVRIMGFGAECSDLMLGDLDGSRSHRNGLLMLLGRDDLVMDKRANNGVTGYKNLPGIAKELSGYADAYLYDFKLDYPGLEHVGYFTLESQCCQFKNSFFGRRYPGVYADMAWERIIWAEEHGWTEQAGIFRQIREDCLPDWLRCEVTNDGMTIKQRAVVFPTTGVPYRAEHFL